VVNCKLLGRSSIPSKIGRIGRIGRISPDKNLYANGLWINFQKILLKKQDFEG